MVRPVGTGFINAAQKSRYEQHLIAAQKSRYGCINFLHCFRGGTASFIAVRSAINEHKNRGCTAGVFPGHKFPDFGIKSVVEISCISTVFLSIILLKKIKYLSLSLTGFPRGGFSRAD